MDKDTLCGKDCSNCSLNDICQGCDVSSNSCLVGRCIKHDYHAVKLTENCKTCQYSSYCSRISLKESLTEIRENLEILGNYRVKVKHLGKLPSLIPIISPEQLDSYCWDLINTGAIIIPFYRLLKTTKLLENAMRVGIHEALKFKEIIILSSVAPDKLLLDPSFLPNFMRVAGEARFDAVIGWDMPVYIDNPLCLSWSNLVRSLENTYNLAEIDLPVIGLIKGGNKSQIEYSARTLFNAGFKTLAIHCSEYMAAGRKDEQAFSTMLYALDTSSKHADQVIALGVTNPYLLRFLQHYPNLIVAGLSWYLDAENYIMYLSGGKSALERLLSSVRANFVEKLIQLGF